MDKSACCAPIEHPVGRKPPSSRESMLPRSTNRHEIAASWNGIGLNTDIELDEQLFSASLA